MSTYICTFGLIVLEERSKKKFESYHERADLDLAFVVQILIIVPEMSQCRCLPHQLSGREFCRSVLTIYSHVQMLG